MLKIALIAAGILLMALPIVVLADMNPHGGEMPAAAGPESTPDSGSAGTATDSRGMGYIAAALAVGLGSLAAGLAVGPTAAAAIGAVAEKEEIAGKALVFVGLAEGLAIYGLVIALMIINRL